MGTEGAHAAAVSTTRLGRELEFQRQQAEHTAEITATPPHILQRYQTNRHWRLFPKEFVYRSMGDLRGKRVLDCGCGTGEITTQLALLGAEVTAFDVSPDLVQLASRRAALDGVSARTNLFVADGETVSLPANRFDFVLVYAVLHHLRIGPALARVRAALRAGGTVFIVEPVCFSRTLAQLRDLVPVPRDVSPDERQLSFDDIDQIRSAFSSSRISYFRALGRLDRLIPQPRRDETRGLWWQLTVALHRVDRALLSVPSAWRLAGNVVIEATK